MRASYEVTSRNLKCARTTGLAWDTQYVDTKMEGAQNNLSLDAAGHAHIVYAGIENLYSKLAASP